MAAQVMWLDSDLWPDASPIILNCSTTTQGKRWVSQQARDLARQAPTPLLISHSLPESWFLPLCHQFLKGAAEWPVSPALLPDLPWLVSSKTAYTPGG